MAVRDCRDLCFSNNDRRCRSVAKGILFVILGMLFVPDRSLGKQDAHVAEPPLHLQGVVVNIDGTPAAMARGST